MQSIIRIQLFGISFDLRPRACGSTNFTINSILLINIVNALRYRIYDRRSQIHNTYNVHYVSHYFIYKSYTTIINSFQF